MLILAIDTATSAITVAVADGSTVLAQETADGGRRHGELLAPAIATVLASAGVRRTDVTSIAVGTGPGPFTGLRVGLVTAQVLGSSLGVPVLGVGSLDVLGFAAVAEGVTGPFRVLTDARRREVYWAAYDGLQRLDGPRVDRPADVAWDGVAVGEGAALYAEHFPGHRTPATPTAAALAGWVQSGLPTTDPAPQYLRRPDIAAAGPRKTVLA